MRSTSIVLPTSQSKSVPLSLIFKCVNCSASIHSSRVSGSPSLIRGPRSAAVKASSPPTSDTREAFRPAAAKRSRRDVYRRIPARAIRSSVSGKSSLLMQAKLLAWCSRQTHRGPPRRIVEQANIMANRELVRPASSARPIPYLPTWLRPSIAPQIDGMGPKDHLDSRSATRSQRAITIRVTCSGDRFLLGPCQAVPRVISPIPQAFFFPLDSSVTAGLLDDHVLHHAAANLMGQR